MFLSVGAMQLAPKKEEHEVVGFGVFWWPVGAENTRVCDKAGPGVYT